MSLRSSSWSSCVVSCCTTTNWLRTRSSLVIVFTTSSSWDCRTEPCRWNGCSAGSATLLLARGAAIPKNSNPACPVCNRQQLAAVWTPSTSPGSLHRRRQAFVSCPVPITTTAMLNAADPSVQTAPVTPSRFFFSSAATNEVRAGACGAPAQPPKHCAADFSARKKHTPLLTSPFAARRKHRFSARSCCPPPARPAPCALEPCGARLAARTRRPPRSATARRGSPRVRGNARRARPRPQTLPWP